MKRVIIFYISEFGGHNKAAKNLKEALLAKNPDMEIRIMNGFAYFYPCWEKITDFLYTLVIKYVPVFWGRIYDRKNVINRLMPLRDYANRNTFKKLAKLIEEFKPDCFIATQAFPCGIVGDFKLHTGSKIPLVAVVTDYHPHRFWIHQQVDMYTVACQEAKEVLVSEGVPENRVNIFGIPISLEFLKITPKEEVCKQLGFLLNLPAVLVMGGGLGIGPIKTVVKHLDELKENFQLIVICGRNKSLYKWFKRRKDSFSKPLFLYSYTEAVNKIMDFTDIIVTKGGGITTSESLAKGLAMIITKPIPGQEERNVKYLLAQKAIIEADQPEDIQNSITKLLKDKKMIEELKKRAKEVSFIDSSLKIADAVLGILK